MTEQFEDKLHKDLHQFLLSMRGAGMGDMEGTCGALVGAGITWGMFTKDRAKSMKGMKQMMMQFHQRNGVTQCKQHKGVRTKAVLCDCPDCAADAAEFLEKL